MRPGVSRIFPPSPPVDAPDAAGVLIGSSAFGKPGLASLGSLFGVKRLLYYYNA